MTDSNFEDATFNVGKPRNATAETDISQDGTEYDPWIAYARSKAANALFALARSASPRRGSSVNESNLRKNGDIGGDMFVRAFGTAKSLGKIGTDDLYQRLPPGILTSQGLDPMPYAHLATMDEGTANLILPLLDPSFRGAYIEECHVNTREEPVLTEEIAEKLWAQSERLLGQTFTW
ncbi:hypothetical protein NLU13_8681 [Sarocladium strictum]|uniref:Uncharacterized protein n=1 Tax=Sarocladium strictum TaxID=5046 RepID=A0AA39GC52_SARSR|nr:hypothetical protein NLU13_8681 [Sarocladium strictum]